MNAPRQDQRTVWINIYPNGIGCTGYAYPTRALAHQLASPGRIACVMVRYEPGDGLEERAA